MGLVGYARVSTVSQNLESQVHQLERHGCEPIFADRYTGRTRRDRTQLAEMLKYLRKGDVVVITKFDRLARNLKDLLNLMDEIHAKGATVQSLGQDFDTATETGRLMFQVMGVVAEYERECIRQRTLEGLAAARADGRVGGRPRALNERQVRVVWDLHRQGDSMRTIADVINVSVGTVHRVIQRERDRRANDTSDEHMDDQNS